MCIFPLCKQGVISGFLQFPLLLRRVRKDTCCLILDTLYGAWESEIKYQSKAHKF